MILNRIMKLEKVVVIMVRIAFFELSNEGLPNRPRVMHWPPTRPVVDQHLPLLSACGINNSFKDVVVSN